MALRVQQRETASREVERGDAGEILRWKEKI